MRHFHEAHRLVRLFLLGTLAGLDPELGHNFLAIGVGVLKREGSAVLLAVKGCATCIAMQQLPVYPFRLSPEVGLQRSASPWHLPFVHTYAKLTIGSFTAGFLLHRGWFRLELAPKARAFLSTG